MNRRGATLVELLFALALGTILLVGSAHLVIGARRAEFRTGQVVDVAEEVGNAAGWLTRDLSAMEQPPARVPVEIGAVEGVEECRLTLQVRAGDVVTPITYTFTPSTGRLVRESRGRSRRFDLGEGARVAFRYVEPAFAGGGAVRLGEFNNRVVYKLTGRRPGAGRLPARTFTLVGAVPCAVKASGDTFRFWNTSIPDRPS